MLETRDDVVVEDEVAAEDDVARQVFDDVQIADKNRLVRRLDSTPAFSKQRFQTAVILQVLIQIDFPR